MVDTQQDPKPEGQPDGGAKAEGKAGGTGSQDTKTPEQLAAHNQSLTRDVSTERERRKTAERELAELRNAQKLSEAKTAEEVQRVREEAAADLARERRTAELEVEAAKQGIHADFIRGADDGKLPVADVIKAAADRQKQFLDAEAKKTGTIKLGGGSSPGGSGGRIFKRSEIEAMDSKAWKENRDEVMKAIAEGRVNEKE